MSEPVFAMIVPMGGGLGGGERPDHGLPGGRPPRPDQGLPGYGYPDQGLPGYGHPDNSLPGAGAPPLPPQINPPPAPVHPGVPIFPLPPNGTLPEEPPTIYPPLPPTLQGRFIVLCWVVGVGYRWFVVDTHPDHELPETPEPK